MDFRIRISVLCGIATTFLFGSESIRCKARLLALISHHKHLNGEDIVAGQPVSSILRKQCARLWQLRTEEQQITRELPILLELLVLLVSAGLGVLPALHRIVHSNSSTPLTKHFAAIYDHTVAGTTLQEALRYAMQQTDHRGLQHVLMHLDISGCEGGSLVPSLRHLSEYSHSLWRMSVEERIKRMETFIVLPVFFCVIGLMLVTAAVPLVPLFDFQERLNSSKVSVLESSASTLIR